MHMHNLPETGDAVRHIRRAKQHIDVEECHLPGLVWLDDEGVSRCPPLLYSMCNHYKPICMAKLTMVMCALTDTG